MSFPRTLCSKCSNNINIIKWLEYLLFGVTYHQVIEPHIIDLVGNNSFSRAYKIILLAYWQGLNPEGLPTFVDLVIALVHPLLLKIHKLQVKIWFIMPCCWSDCKFYRYEVIVEVIISCNFIVCHFV